MNFDVRDSRLKPSLLKEDPSGETVLALTVKIRKSHDFLAPISGSPGDHFFFTHFQKFNLSILKLSFME